MAGRRWLTLTDGGRCPNHRVQGTITAKLADSPYQQGLATRVIRPHSRGGPTEGRAGWEEAEAEEKREEVVGTVAVVAAGLMGRPVGAAVPCSPSNAGRPGVRHPSRVEAVAVAVAAAVPSRAPSRELLAKMDLHGSALHALAAGDGRGHRGNETAGGGEREGTARVKDEDDDDDDSWLIGVLNRGTLATGGCGGGAPDGWTDREVIMIAGAGTCCY